jgi:hypothetical protein
MQPTTLTWADPATDQALTNRAAANRANAKHSTGPRTEAGKKRSSLNALAHGLTARTTVLDSEDRAAYEHHLRQFHNEYQPANATETQLVQELADTAWRQNRIPLLEAALLNDATTAEPSPSPQSLVPALASLGLHSARLSRQFQKTLENLREIQLERRAQERRDLRDAAAILELHKHKGLPWNPADHGFVFSVTIYLTDHAFSGILGSWKAPRPYSKRFSTLPILRTVSSS